MTIRSRLRIDPVLVLIMALCVLLPVLALLQFSWIGDVQKADETRMRAALQRSSDHLAEEFNGELARFYRSVLAPGPMAQLAPSATNGAPSALSTDDPCQRFQRWHTAAAQPRLIRAIYVVTEGAQLQSCNVETGKLQPAAWPGDLKASAELWMPNAGAARPSINFKDYVPMLPAPWRSFRAADGGRTSAGRMAFQRAWRTHPPGAEGLTFADERRFREFREERRDRERAERGEGLRQFQPPLGTRGGQSLTIEGGPRFFRFPPGSGPAAIPALALAVPDLAWIQSQWLPELVTKHFGHPSTSDSVVRVEVAVPHLKVYESGAWSPGSADAAVALWHAPGLNTAFGVAGAFGGAPGTENSAEHTQPAAAAEPATDSASAERRHVSSLRGPGSSYWTLLARLKAGPVANIAAQTRFRNLSVGGGILLLLGATMALLIVTLRRQRRLARQQMEFVAGVSHELRTPVAVLSSAGENLADGIVTQPASVREYGAMIRDEARRLSGMIEQTLRFAGIQSGGVRYNRQPVDIGEAVDAAVRNHDALIRSSGCTIERRWNADLPRVMADPAALAHCLGNLVANAARYGSAGAWIGIHASAITPANGTPSRVSIEVADHGEGIDVKDLPHLFEPFYRGHQIRERQIQGTGLGLALVKRIVEDLGGDVRVQSVRQKGSCFTLTLPVAAPAAAMPVIATSLPEEIH